MQSTADCGETPKDENEMVDKEGAQQTGLFVAVSNQYSIRLLNHINYTDSFPGGGEDGRITLGSSYCKWINL